MEIEKLIEQANRFGMELRRDGGEFEYSIGEKFLNYATALSTLQAENEKLRSEAEGMRSNWYKSVEEIQKLRAELEKVMRERDAAQSLLAGRIGVRGAEPITTAFGLPIDRLRELAQADREGRCLVLKCKPNDTVWFIKSAFSMAHFPIEGNYVSIRGVACDGDIYCSAITAYNKINRSFYMSDIGKTVFLTREEAQAALRREQE